MARFDERSGQLYVTELGRVASHYYIRHSSIVAFNEMLRPHMSEAEVLPTHTHSCFEHKTAVASCGPASSVQQSCSESGGQLRLT